MLRPFLIMGFVALLLGGCGKKSADNTGLTHVRLQTDWFPQAEHGGYYYALIHGYYKDEGLDVDILPGGMNFMGALKVTERQAEFGMNTADAILRHQAQGMPLEMVMATLQHNPMGIMFHASHPLGGFGEIDGRPLMAMPGATWLEFLRAKYHIDPKIVPDDKGLERFLADPQFLQQCMATSEPYFARLRGSDPEVLPLSTSGFDPYHVLYTNSDYAAAHPQVVAAFVRASKRGWIDYLTKDPASTFAEIKRRNPRQTDGAMSYARQQLIDKGYAFGDGGPAHYGEIAPGRIEALKQQMASLGLLK